MRLTLLGRVVAVLVVPIALSGCQLLFPSMYYPPDYPDPGAGASFQLPPMPVDVSYETGTATIDLGDGAPVVLDELVEGSGVTYGATTLTWRNADGWAVSVNSFGIPGEPASPFDNSVGIKRIVDKSFWVTDTTFNPGACKVALDEHDADGFKGSATCTNVRWQDGLTADPMYTGTPEYVDGQPPFDATITFEAHAKAK